MTDSDMFRPVNRRAGSATEAWSPILPVPHDAPKSPAKHYKLGMPSTIYSYKDRDGKLLGYVFRSETDNGKIFAPLTFCVHRKSGRSSWRWKGFPIPRPLFGLEDLNSTPRATVVVCEGEKAAEAARELLPGFVVVTSPNGSNSADKADWRPLSGRDVVIWPDADDAGRKYAAAVCRSLKAMETEPRVISPPEDVFPGWDAADALEAGIEQSVALQMVNDAKPPELVLGGIYEASASNDRPPRKRKSEDLVRYADDIELWHSTEREAYASVSFGRSVEHLKVRSEAFQDWLAEQFYECEGSAPSDYAIREAQRVISIRAMRGPTHELFIRVGRFDGRIYIDLADDPRQIIEVSRTGWSIANDVPVKFFRPAGMTALPLPDQAGSIGDLAEFCNVRDETDLVIIVSWLVSALRPDGPFPILVVNGEQGSAKSTTTRVLQSLVDPSVLVGRGSPREERDLFIAAHNSWCLQFDNISHVANWFSDALCRISTGGGFATRKLHTDRTELILTAQRPVIMNGIPDLAARPDLADRCILLTLPPIPPERRRPESEFWREFEIARPRIFGCLLDGLVEALVNIDDVSVHTAPRMADFAYWISAAEPAFGWKAGTSLDAYESNRQRSVDVSMESDPVAEAVLSATKDQDFEGTATELVEKLNVEVTESIRRSRSWVSAYTVKNRLRRLQPPLRSKGVVIELDIRGGGKDNPRLIAIRRPDRIPAYEPNELDDEVPY